MQTPCVFTAVGNCPKQPEIWGEKPLEDTVKTPVGEGNFKAEKIGQQTKRNC